MRSPPLGEEKPKLPMHLRQLRAAFFGPRHAARNAGPVLASLIGKNNYSEPKR
jgi:hypothetical protein